MVDLRRPSISAMFRTETPTHQAMRAPVDLRLCAFAHLEGHLGMCLMKVMTFASCYELKSCSVLCVCFSLEKVEKEKDVVTSPVS